MALFNWRYIVYFLPFMYLGHCMSYLNGYYRHFGGNTGGTDRLGRQLLRQGLQLDFLQQRLPRRTPFPPEVPLDDGCTRSSSKSRSSSARLARASSARRTCSVSSIPTCPTKSRPIGRTIADRRGRPGHSRLNLRRPMPRRRDAPPLPAARASAFAGAASPAARVGLDVRGVRPDRKARAGVLAERFPAALEEHRYYQTLEETFAGEFPQRYLVLRDTGNIGPVRVMQPLFFVEQDLTVSLAPGCARLCGRCGRWLRMRLMMVGCIVGEAQIGVPMPPRCASSAAPWRQGLERTRGTRGFPSSCSRISRWRTVTGWSAGAQWRLHAVA